MNLPLRSLLFHWRTHVAVALGVAVGTAALTGALIVGDSMRASLRELAVGRLGRVDHAVLAPRFFRQQLAATMAGDDRGKDAFDAIVPAILLRGGVSDTDGRAYANNVNVLGVPDDFHALAAKSVVKPSGDITGRAAAINQTLADELGLGEGDAVILRLARPAAISTETLLGRRDDRTVTLRLRVEAVIPAEGLGVFSLNPQQTLPRNILVPLETLQRALDQEGRVNALLIAAGSDPRSREREASGLQSLIDTHATLDDLGLRLRAFPDRDYMSLESRSMLISPPVETAAMEAATAADLRPTGVITYLANRIRRVDGNGDGVGVGVGAGEFSIPYSTVAAVEPSLLASDAAEFLTGTAADFTNGTVLLNQWAADDLSAAVGDRIELSYYVTGPFGQLNTQQSTFSLAGVLAMRGSGADPGLTPEYKGVTDARNLVDWDPPFPMDFTAIRDKDEAYWDEHGPAPKALITLEDGDRLWTEDADRLGRLTAIRLSEVSPSTTNPADKFERALMQRLDVAALGLVVRPVRQQLLAASTGSTDFGGLFIGFSFFLIAAAAMLVALLFRLGVERRAGEIGLFRATGFTPRRTAVLFIAEGAAVAAVGVALGLAAAIAYAALMLHGLKTWWSQAVNMPFLALDVQPLSVAIGLVASFVIALGSIAWSMRGLTGMSVRALLAGAVAAGRSYAARPPRLAPWIALVAFLLALAATFAPLITDAIPSAPAFFTSGVGLLVGCLAVFARRLRIEPRRAIDPTRQAVITLLGLRNARRHAGRSILTAGLIASATFLIAALQAFRLDAGAGGDDLHSGTGGFELYAEAAVPLVYDLNTPDGRESLGVPADAESLLADATIIPFRLRPGDQASCLSLYRPQQPRIIGAPPAMIERDGFTFAATLSMADRASDNPWALMDATLDDGAIPVIGDEAAVLWQLHLDLGETLTITDERGQPHQLRFVALLSQSALQDELIVSEANFEKLFPSIDGYGFFLIDTPHGAADEVERTLEQALYPYAFDAGSMIQRLSNYLAVQNTYLSTFQMLGGFGLILGTIGLTAVMLRNIWERRAELALMRALGFSRFSIAALVLSENIALLCAGLLAGTVSAMLAIAPHILDRPESIPWLSLGLILLAVLATGTLAAVLAVIPTLRAPLIPSLRAE